MNKHVLLILGSSVFYHDTSRSDPKYTVFHELRFISVFKEMQNCSRHPDIRRVCAGCITEDGAGGVPRRAPHNGGAALPLLPAGVAGGLRV